LLLTPPHQWGFLFNKELFNIFLYVNIFIIKMEKIVNLTESDIKRIVGRVLSEQSKEYMNIPKAGCEVYKKGCDPYRYLKVVDGANTKYYYKRDSDPNWIQAKNMSGITSIRQYITFNSKPEVQSKLNLKPVVSEPKGLVKGDKMKIDNNKLINGNYSTEELRSIVNAWKPTYDFNLQGKTDQDKKIFDWKTNVDKTANATYNWRNRQIEKIRTNPYLNKTKKKEAESDVLALSQLVADKLEKEYQARWDGIA
jgi:hypothetical protein